MMSGLRISLKVDVGKSHVNFIFKGRTIQSRKQIMVSSILPKNELWAQWVRLQRKWVHKLFIIILAKFVKSSSKIFNQLEIVLQTDINFPT